MGNVRVLPNVNDYIRYDISMYKEKYTMDKRCKQIENILQVLGYDVDKLYVKSYTNPYLFTLSTSNDLIEDIIVEANASLILFKDKNKKILYNFITSRYLECE